MERDRGYGETSVPTYLKRRNTVLYAITTTIAVLVFPTLAIVGVFLIVGGFSQLREGSKEDEEDKQ